MKPPAASRASRRPRDLAPRHSLERFEQHLARRRPCGNFRVDRSDRARFPGFGPAPAEDYSASRYDYRRADTSAPFTSALSAQVHVQFGRPSGSQQARDHLPATSVSTRVTAAGPIVRRRTARRGQRRLMSLRQLRRPSFSIERVMKVRRGRRPVPDAYDSRGRARAEAIAPCPWRA